MKLNFDPQTLKLSLVLGLSLLGTGSLYDVLANGSRANLLSIGYLSAASAGLVSRVVHNKAQNESDRAFKLAMTENDRLRDLGTRARKEIAELEKTLHDTIVAQKADDAEYLKQFAEAMRKLDEAGDMLAERDGLLEQMQARLSAIQAQRDDQRSGFEREVKELKAKHDAELAEQKGLYEAFLEATKESLWNEARGEMRDALETRQARYNLEMQSLKETHRAELEALETRYSKRLENTRGLVKKAVTTQGLDSEQKVKQIEETYERTIQDLSYELQRLTEQLAIKDQQLGFAHAPRQFQEGSRTAMNGNRLIALLAHKEIISDAVSCKSDDGKDIIWLKPRVSRPEDVQRLAQLIQVEFRLLELPTIEAEEKGLKFVLQVEKDTAIDLEALQALMVSPGLPDFLTQDLGELVAVEGFQVETVVSPDPVSLMLQNIKHTLLAAPTRSGKSTLLFAYIRGLFATVGNGNFELVILDPKTSSWLGLETQRQIVKYAPVNKPWVAAEAVHSVYSEMNRRTEAVQKALKEGQQVPEFKPLYFIFDEFTSAQAALENYDKKLSKTMTTETEAILSLGAGLKVFMTLVGQSHLAGDLGMTAVIRDCMNVFCLGSPEGGYTAIEKAITDQYLVSPRQKAALNKAWTTLKSQSAGYLYFSTLGSEPRVGITPDLSAAVEPLKFKSSVFSDGSAATTQTALGAEGAEPKIDVGLDPFSALPKPAQQYLSSKSDLELKALWEAYSEHLATGKSTTAFIREGLKISQHGKGKAVLQGLEMKYGNKGD